MFASQRRKKWVKTLPKRFSSAVMVLETADGEILTVKSNYKPYWTLPGGIVDPGETPRECALRETLEEVGIKVDPTEVEFVAVVDRKSAVAQTYQFIFKTHLDNADKKAIHIQASEIAEYAFLTKNQILQRDRPLAKAVEHWANDVVGYREQTFEGGV
jgi:8-oxo-dGTP pyrophosphatase MutT (NUDIX family)